MNKRKISIMLATVFLFHDGEGDKKCEDDKKGRTFFVNFLSDRGTNRFVKN